jgi:hypothetical protein
MVALRRRCGRTSSRPKDSADAGDQFPWIAGLGHVVVRPEFKTDNTICDIRGAGQKDDSNAASAEAATNLQAAFARQHGVKDDQI